MSLMFQDVGSKPALIFGSYCCVWCKANETCQLLGVDTGSQTQSFQKTLTSRDGE